MENHWIKIDAKMDSKTDTPITIEKRTWYGINATVIIGQGFLHTAGFGFFLIPHPPVVNWLLRQKTAKRNLQALTCVHEFQHFQTAPFLLIYTFLLFTVAFALGRVGFIEVIILLVSCQAMWEMAAEMLTIRGDTQFYHNAYKNISIIPRTAFWTAACVFAIAGWVIVFV